jgi:polysaccharide export outer membrane protein
VKIPQGIKKRSTRTNLICIFGITLGLLIFAITPAKILALQEEKELPGTDYKIGPKDLLQITVFELPELNQTVRVSEDGSVTLSLLGKVEVAGLTAQELEQKLATILEGKYLKTAHVTVFIKEYQRVAILGAVAKPGMYELVGPTTLLQVISEAGGLTADASNDLYVYREGTDGQKTKITVNLADLIVKGNQSLNIDLKAKDIVNVPIDQMLTIFVYGEVKTPGAIRFKQSKMCTLLQAIAQAGGTTEWASKSGVVISRKDQKTGKDKKIRVNLKDIISGKNSDIVLEEGDVIIVP